MKESAISIAGSSEASRSQQAISHREHAQKGCAQSTVDNHGN
jgi:hypothetical protein